MVVNSVTEGWEIVFHRAHALLAARIALHWARQEGVERVPETIAAIAQHDDLEREFEGDHLTAAGAPLDFTLRPKDENAELPRWEEMLTCSLYRSRWVALLTACHICFLNAEKRGASPELEAFLREVETRTERWRRELGVTKKDVETSYAFLQWCDRLSLILVQNELPEKERWLEISAGPDGTDYSLRQRNDKTIEVSPWPFRENEFTVEVDTRILTDLRFADNESLTLALQRACVRARCWTFRKGPKPK